MHRAPSIYSYPGFQSALRGKYISNLWEEETLTGVLFSSAIFNSVAALVNSQLVCLLSVWILHVTSLTITEFRQFFEKPLHIATLLTAIFLDSSLNHKAKIKRLVLWCRGFVTIEMRKNVIYQIVQTTFIIILCIFSSFSLAESPPRDLQITACR